MGTYQSTPRGVYLTPDSGVHPSEIVSDMERVGYRKIAASIALESLRRKGLIEVVLKLDSQVGDEYQVYKVTEAGVSWCLENQDKLNMKTNPPKPAPGRIMPQPPQRVKEDEDDIPF